MVGLEHSISFNLANLRTEHAGPNPEREKRKHSRPDAAMPFAPVTVKQPPWLSLFNTFTAVSSHLTTQVTGAVGLSGLTCFAFSRNSAALVTGPHVDHSRSHRLWLYFDRARTRFCDFGLAFTFTFASGMIGMPLGWRLTPRVSVSAHVGGRGPSLRTPCGGPWSSHLFLFLVGTAGLHSSETQKALWQKASQLIDLLPLKPKHQLGQRSRELRAHNLFPIAPTR